MEQLVIEGIHLPEVRGDQYACYPDTLSVSVDMISGRRVIEKRGTVYYIEYSVDYLPDSMMKPLLAALRKKTDIGCFFLADNAEADEELRYSTFVLESISNPVFAFSRYGKPMWHNVSFRLREVKPSD